MQAIERFHSAHLCTRIDSCTSCSLHCF